MGLRPEVLNPVHDKIWFIVLALAVDKAIQCNFIFADSKNDPFHRKIRDFIFFRCSGNTDIKDLTAFFLENVSYSLCGISNLESETPSLNSRSIVISDKTVLKQCF